MIVFCSSCYAAVRVLDSDDRAEMLVGRRSDFFPHYPCLQCTDKKNALYEESEFAQDLYAKLRIRDLSSEEYFRALMGLGTPDEMVCAAEVVRDLLLSQRIKGVHGQDVVGTGRFQIQSLELADGTSLHLGASAHGAIVFRITRPVSYVRKVLDGK